MPITQEQIQEARAAADAYLDSLIAKHGISKLPTRAETLEATRLEQIYRDLTTQMIEEGGEVVTPKKHSKVDPMDTIKEIVQELDDNQLKELEELITAIKADREELKKNIYVHMPGQTIHFQATDEHPEEECITRIKVISQLNFGYSFTVPSSANISEIITEKWLGDTQKIYGNLTAIAGDNTYQFDNEIHRSFDLANHFRALFTEQKIECGDIEIVNE